MSGRVCLIDGEAQPIIPPDLREKPRRPLNSNVRFFLPLQTMKSEYFNVLPERFQQMVVEIESAIGQEIVTRRPEASDPDFMRSDTLAYCHIDLIDGRVITEIVFPLDETPVRHIAHEVTHIHRSFVQQVDLLCAKVADGGGNDMNANAIDNDLEHIAFVPEEIACFPDSAKAWEADFWQQLERHQGAAHLSVLPLDSAMQERLNLLRAFAVASLILPHWPHLRDYEQVLHRQGILRDGKLLVTKLATQRSRKADQIATMIRFAKLAPQAFEISRFESSSVSELRRPIQLY
ncbi:MAG: hypothetical protein WA056_13430 [Gallionella sp.]